jgi:uncharacterized protein (TIGR02118 family)
MTVKLVVLYTHPGDPEAFDQHYLGTHMPLVRKVPGLQRAESGLFSGAVDGDEQTFYRIAALYFADRAALNAGLGSDEGQAVATDYQNIAPSGSRLFVADVDE